MEPVFEKEQQLVQGPGILKVRARLCRVTVLHIFSQETGVLLFYVNPNQLCIKSFCKRYV